MIAANGITSNVDDDDDSINDDESRTELDSHANMAVVGRHCRVIANSGKTVSVQPFTPEYNSLQDIPIVDAAIKWTHV